MPCVKASPRKSYRPIDCRVYVACDLKSFYASVECIERNLDPLNTNLVVADETRSEKTICLAATPTLKSYGIAGRARLFEVVQRIKEINAMRLWKAPGRTFTGSSYSYDELKASPELSVDYIIAPPQMALYIQYSARIYDVYLKYFAPEDIHVYSIDEVFIDVTDYLETYKLKAKELTMKVILDIIQTTGITATAGIGTNPYLAKVAMDIVAKKIPADDKGVRIACLDEKHYRRLLWDHKPITDFWRVGRGIAKRLEKCGLYTMGDIAKCSVGKPDEYHNEELLYKLLGINAELLIDHAWGWEPTTIEVIKAYKPSSNCLNSGQVLHEPYTFDQAKLVIREMSDLLALDMVKRKVVTNQIVLTIGYDIENLKDPVALLTYQGNISVDYYGRAVPKHAHGTCNLGEYTSSAMLLTQAVMELYDRIVAKNLLIRRLNVTVNNVIDENALAKNVAIEQLNLFTDYTHEAEIQAVKEAMLDKERRCQLAILSIRKRFGPNAILKCMNLLADATTVQRNNQIGGHRA